jgi:hypothetical protein
MFRVALELEWERPARGRGFALEGGRIVRVPGATFARYHPLREETGLFRTFARTDPSPDGILDFANRFGELGWPEYVSAGVVSGSDPAGDLRAWQHHVAEMRRLVALWDALKQGDWRGVVKQLPTYLIGLKPPAADARLADLAVTHLLSTVGQELTTLVRPPDSPDLLPEAEPVRRLLGGVRGGWDPVARQPVARLVVRGLLQAMYCQFAWSMLGDKKYNCCPVCGKWFEVGPAVQPGARSDKSVCSTSCRVKQYRRRKYRARELRAGGWSLARIARELGTDTDTIKRWVSQHHKE